MTRRAKRAQNSLFQVHLTQSLLFDKTLALDPGAVYSRLRASPAFAHVDCVPRRARAHLRQPAHHHVHHSANPKHFNKNFGSCLALWDWMFGTLYVPEK
jgi:hypothetical protein